jgi:GNAT superfamily N-acetyltransferase
VVEIRSIRESDWPQVHDLVLEVAMAGETYTMEVPRSVEETREFWTGQQVVVAVDGETVLGSAKMGPNRPAQGAHVGTASFVVESAARGHGVGRALGEYAVEWHRANNFAAIQFNAVVSTNTGAIKLWESLGFETIGVVPGAFRLPSGEGGSSYADLHVMYLGLAAG